MQPESLCVINHKHPWHFMSSPVHSLCNVSTSLFLSPPVPVSLPPPHSPLSLSAAIYPTTLTPIGQTLPQPPQVIQQQQQREGEGERTILLLHYTHFIRCNTWEAHNAFYTERISFCAMDKRRRNGERTIVLNSVHISSWLRDKLRLRMMEQCYFQVFLFLYINSRNVPTIQANTSIR